MERGFFTTTEENAIPVKTFVDDNDYHIWGFHFFNRDMRGNEFGADFEMLKKSEGHMKVLSSYAKGIISES